MARPALHLSLSKRDRSALKEILEGGFQPVRVVFHALALRWLDRGRTAGEIAALIPLTAQTVRNIIRRYTEGGLDRALFDQPRPGPKPLLDESQRQRLVAMICGAPPAGHARWTVRLIAEEAVRRKLLPGVGRETVRVVLLHHDIRPWPEKHVVRAGTHR